MTGRSVRHGLAILLFAAVTAPVYAQSYSTTGTLTGVVLDPLGAVVPQAIVTAKAHETGLARTVVSHRDGRFTFVAMPLGRFDVSADAAGFRSEIVRGVEVTVGSTLNIAITLQVDAVRITTSASAALAEQDTQISAIIPRAMLNELPINGRNFVSFTLMTPSVATDRTPVQGSSATSGLTFGGQSARANNIMLDGLDNTEAALGTVRGTLSQEAVREIDVLAHSFSAEFGKATGGVVNIVTRSGSNTFAGSGFLYVRDDALNAKAHFERFDTAGRAIERSKAPFEQAQFGGAGGGPLRRNHTFFFASFERQRTDANNFVNIDDRLAVTHPLTGAALGTPADVLRRAGFQFDTGNVPYVVRGDQALVRVDHNWRQQHVALRVNYADYLDENSEPFGGIVAKSRAGSLDSTDRAIALSHTAVFSERLVTETRVQFAGRDQNVLPLDPACNGPCLNETQGGPTIEVAGVAALGRHRAMPQPRSADRWQVVGAVTTLRRNHQIKSGADFSFIGNRSSIPLHFGGRYIFAALPAVPGARPAMSAIQAVAAGVPVAYIQGYGTSRGDYDYRDLSLFVQDDWRVTPGLTIKGGLRYQSQAWERVAQVDPVIGAYEFPRDATLAPRVGVAWSPNHDRAVVLHAGAGSFYGNHVTTLTSSVKIFNGANARTLAVQGPGAAAAWGSPGHRLPEPTTPFPSLQLLAHPDLKAAVTHQVSGGVDYQLPGHVAISANVMYSRGRHHLGSIDFNPLSPELGPGRRWLDIQGVPGTSASIIHFTSYGRSEYRALALTARRREGRHTFFASYTLGRATDNTVDFQSQFLPHFNGRGHRLDDPRELPRDFDPMLDYGLSQQHQRHRLVISGTTEGPFGLRVASIVTVGSGRPYSALSGFDFNRDGDATNDRARRDPTVAPNDYTTTVPRNELTLPSQAAIDLRVSRAVRIAGTLVEGMVECFNLLNRSNFTEVNSVFGNGAYPSNPLPAFGQFTQAAPPRQVQLAVRVSF